MASVVISGDTSGSVTLSAPAVAGTTTLTLPTVSGTVAVSGDTPSFAGITDTGNLTFTGTGNRITGDMTSGISGGSPLAFQTSTANSLTQLYVIPNGTSKNSFLLLSSGTSANENFLQFGINNIGNQAVINSGIIGTGTYQPMVFSTGGSERMRIDTSGNVGIGTSSPATKLNVVGSVSASDSTTATKRLQLDIGASSGTINCANYGSDMMDLNIQGENLIFNTGLIGVAERMRIDSSGNVGIGAASTGARLQVTASSTDTSAYYNGARQIIQNSSATTNNFDTLSFVTSNGNDAAAIWTIIGSHTSAAATGTLVFGTSNAAAAATERMRIDSSGNMVFASRSGAGNTAQIQVGLTSALGTGINAYGQFAADSSSPYPLGVKGNSSSQGMIGFFDSANGVVGSISKSGSSVAYNTSSDYRLKEDVQPMSGALERVAALKPVTYKWKADGLTGEGFIAHELAEVCPTAVTGEKDAVNEDGSIKPQGIDTSFLVATLTAAIQEQQALIQQLQADMEILKGKA